MLLEAINQPLDTLVWCLLQPSHKSNLGKSADRPQCLSSRVRQRLVVVQRSLKTLKSLKLIATILVLWHAACSKRDQMVKEDSLAMTVMTKEETRNLDSKILRMISTLSLKRRESLRKVIKRDIPDKRSNTLTIEMRKNHLAITSNVLELDNSKERLMTMRRLLSPLPKRRPQPSQLSYLIANLTGAMSSEPNEIKTTQNTS